MRHTRSAKVAAVAMALALAASACGSDRSDEDAGGSSNTAPAADIKEGFFGDLESPCGDGDASGSTDQGVTDDAITIGYGDDRGFSARPGLLQEMGDAMTAMIAWCNAQGGINGREIKGNQYDAAYMNAASVMQQACKTDFMMVGQGFANDIAAEPYRVECNLPSVPGFAIGPAVSMGPMKYEPVPFPVDRYNGAMLETIGEQHPEFLDNMDFVRSTSPAVTQGLVKVEAALADMGTTPKDCGVTIASEGEPSYVPFAEKFKECDVEAIWVTDTPDARLFSFMEALDRVGADPLVVGESTWYSEVVSGWNAKSGAGDNVVVGLQFQPFENADVVPAVAQYMDLMKDSGGKRSLLGMQATSAFLLWATAAKECGSDLTRQCMVDTLSQIHEWDGGGLHAPADPGANETMSCTVVMELEGGNWEQTSPKEKGEFNCDEGFVMETDKSTWGIELNEDRLATDFLTDDMIVPSV
ncbi:ABC transporter substrate-binding protein [Nocardioides pacificus]